MELTFDACPISRRFDGGYNRARGVSDAHGSDRRGSTLSYANMIKYLIYT